MYSAKRHTILFAHQHGLAGRKWATVSEWTTHHTMRRVISKLGKPHQRKFFASLLSRILGWAPDADPDHNTLEEFYILRELLTGQKVVHADPSELPGALPVRGELAKQIARETHIAPKRRRNNRSRRKRKVKPVPTKREPLKKALPLVRGIEATWSKRAALEKVQGGKILIG